MLNREISSRLATVKTGQIQVHLVYSAFTETQSLTPAAGAAAFFQEEPTSRTRYRGNEIPSLFTTYQRGTMLKESRGPHRWSSQLHRTPFCAGILQGWTTRLNLHRLLHRCSCGKKMCFSPPKCSFSVSLTARRCSSNLFSALHHTQ